MCINTLGAAQGDATAGHDLVEHQQSAILCAQLSAALHELKAGSDEIHVARDRFDHYAGHVLAVLCEGLLQLLDVVVFQHQRVLHYLGRYAGTGGVAKGCQARPRLDQQCICMAVVATFELYEFLAAGGTTRKAQRAHRGLGAGANQPHHVHGRN